jgi:hypothetical protein
MLGVSGSSASARPTKGNDVTVGLLLPETANTRYENFDYPIVKKQVASLTRNEGKVDYANAEQDAKEGPGAGREWPSSGRERSGSDTVRRPVGRLLPVRRAPRGTAGVSP